MVRDEYWSAVVNTEQSPEVKLWLYTLCEAIREAAAGRVDERFWLLEDTRTHVGSFYWVCEVCDIDANRLRIALHKRWDQILTKHTRLAVIVMNRGLERCQIH